MSAVLLTGLFQGIVYGLLAVGLVVVYRGSRVVNFAQGETGMLGAFIFMELRFGSGYIITEDRGLWPALPVGVLVAAAVGALTEFVTVRRLRNAPRIRPLVATLAVATLLITYAVRRWGTETRMAQPLTEGDGIQVLGLQVQMAQLLILVVSAGVLVGLWALYRFTGFGLRLRATALDPYAAGLVGVDINRTSMLTWALAGALAGLSAILIAPLIAFNVWFMAGLSMRALAAALIGGLTNVGGAFGAGIALGLAEGFITFTSPVDGVTDVAIAAFVLIAMVARPTGIVRSAY